MSGPGSARRMNGFVVLGYAVTPLHPGVGRAPGVVDLPVQRDPMGYPLVFASSVKGALKAECGRRAKGNGSCFDQRGRINCDDSSCALCCCLFGHEPEGGRASAALLSVLDFIPIAFPVPSLDMGYVYVTTPYLARRALSILDAIIPTPNNKIKEFKEFLKVVASLGAGAEDKVYGCLVDRNATGGKVTIGLEEVTVESIEKLNKNSGDSDGGGSNSSDGGACRGLRLLEELGGLAGDISSRLIVVSDDRGPLYVEKGLIRVTRVRLNVATKTVSGGALWTEEYIPAGTLFLGGFIATLPKKNEYCAKISNNDNNNGEQTVEADNNIITSEGELKNLIEKFKGLMGGDDGGIVYMIVGGKETIGRGLVKLRLYINLDEPARGDDKDDSSSQ